MTKPLTPAGCDLRDFPHTPLFRSRLFGSSFHARATDSEWRAGVTLWLKSWDQVPAGSLPDDDIELCRLAELARDLKQWRKVRAGALRGWALATDGRLYHPVVAEGINNALEHKAAQRAKTAKARLAALEKRLKECTTDADKAHVSGEIQRLKLSLSQTTGKPVTDPASDDVTAPKREGREGEGISSVPNGTAAADAAAAENLEDEARKRIAEAQAWLEGNGLTAGQAKAFRNTVAKDYAAVAREAFAEAIKTPAPAGEAQALVLGIAKRLTGERKDPVTIADNPGLSKTQAYIAEQDAHGAAAAQRTEEERAATSARLAKAREVAASAAARFPLKAVA